VRFVNGSPDAGPVQLFIDNQEQFCTNGASGAGCAIAYGSVTGYAVNLKAGAHAIILRDVNGNQIAISGFSGSFSVNGGARYSMVLTGELHPTYTGTSNLSLTTFTDQPFSGGPAVNFHQASPYVQSLNGSGGVQFGFYTGTTPASNSLGQPAAFGSATTSQSVPSSAQNVPITFYAMSPTSGFTTTPSDISTSCASNALPCSTGNLSLYLIDGPAASTTPNLTGTLPTGISASSTAGFVGSFD
jgi:hypothetical protein